VQQILEGGRRIDMRMGGTVKRSRKPGVAIVLDGLLRVYLESAHGRQLTVRYARLGDTLGLTTLFGAKLDVHVQAVTASALWTVPSRRLRELAQEHALLATAIAEECASLVGDAIEELALLTFGSVKQRVARHLIDLAAGDAATGRLVAAVTQQELAHACGSVREVVARVLNELQADGLTARSRAGVVILDAAGLDAAARE
jgi:CRP/FNR family transcriptional regulator